MGDHRPTRLKPSSEIVEAEFRAKPFPHTHPPPDQSLGTGVDPATLSRMPGYLKWRKWEWLLFVPALFVYAVRESIPWLQRQGVVKVFLCFMGLWLFWGIFSVTLDSGAGSGQPDLAAQPRIPHEFCIQSLPGGMPFGKLYLMGTACTAWLSAVMFDSLGFQDASRWIANRYFITWNEYWYHGQFSLAYIWIGAVGFATVSVIPLWIFLWIVRLLALNVSITWR